MRPFILLLLLTLPCFAQTQTGPLQQLQNGEQLSIEFSSLGCFHRYTYKLVITRKGPQWEVSAYSSQENILQGGHFYYMFDDGYWFLQSRILNVSDLQKLTPFIEHLKKIKKPDNRWFSCTTIDNYIVRSKYLSFEATDGECQWNGFDHLIASWFGHLNASPHFSDCLF